METNHPPGLTISRLAARSGVGVETIRFYERKGLLERPVRPSRGYRKYPPEAAKRIRFVRRAKELGFTLQEVAELLDLRVDAASACADMRTRASAKLEDVTGRIADLQRMAEGLSGLISACDLSVPTTPCPILDALERPDA